MSVVHRVIKLNQPFKIRGYTVTQWLTLVGSVCLAFLVGSKVPTDLKVANLPLGFIVGLLILCAAIVFVSASQMKPFAWWRNKVLYFFNLAPKQFLPHPEPGRLYPDPTVVDAVKKGKKNYVEMGE